MLEEKGISMPNSINILSRKSSSYTKTFSYYDISLSVCLMCNNRVKQ